MLRRWSLPRPVAHFFFHFCTRTGNGFFLHTILHPGCATQRRADVVASQAPNPGRNLCPHPAFWIPQGLPLHLCHPSRFNSFLGLLLSQSAVTEMKSCLTRRFFPKVRDILHHLLNAPRAFPRPLDTLCSASGTPME